MKDIEVPVFKEKLKSKLMARQNRILRRKIIFYRTGMVAAILLFIFSTTLFITSGNNKSILQTRRTVASFYMPKISDEEVDAIIKKESAKSSENIYPVEVKNVMIKSIKLSNGKNIKIVKNLDNEYAMGY